MAEKVLADGTVVQISRADSEALARDYFAWRRRIYDFLHDRLRDGFRGDADAANGTYYSGCYHGGWDHLDSRRAPYTVAARLLDSMEVTFQIRNGDAYMVVRTSRDMFPKMEIVTHLNAKPYGRKPIGSWCDVWQCNETEFDAGWHPLKTTPQAIDSKAG